MREDAEAEEAGAEDSDVAEADADEAEEEEAAVELAAAERASTERAPAWVALGLAGEACASLGASADLAPGIGATTQSVTADCDDDDRSG